MRPQLVDTLSRRQKDLRVTDLEAAAFVILSACEEVMHTSGTGAPSIEQDRLLDALADMVTRYIFR